MFKSMIKALAYNDTIEITRLLDAGHNPNSLNPATGLTLLMAAALDGHLELVKYLVSKGADLSIVDDEGFGALNFAEIEGHEDVIEWVKARQQPAPPPPPPPPSQLKGGDKPKKQVTELEQHAPQQQLQLLVTSAAMLAACVKCDTTAIAKLLDSGESVHSIDSEGWTLLMMVLYYGQLNAAKLLVRRGADISTLNAVDDSALDYAHDGGHQDCIKWAKKIFDEVAADAALVDPLAQSRVVHDVIEIGDNEDDDDEVVYLENANLSQIPRKSDRPLQKRVDHLETRLVEQSEKASHYQLKVKQLTENIKHLTANVSAGNEKLREQGEKVSQSELKIKQLKANASLRDEKLLDQSEKTTHFQMKFKQLTENVNQLTEHVSCRDEKLKEQSEMVAVYKLKIKELTEKVNCRDEKLMEQASLLKAVKGEVNGIIEIHEAELKDLEEKFKAATNENADHKTQIEYLCLLTTENNNLLLAESLAGSVDLNAYVMKRKAGGVTNASEELHSQFSKDMKSIKQSMEILSPEFMKTNRLGEGEDENQIEKKEVKVKLEGGVKVKLEVFDDSMKRKDCGIDDESDVSKKAKR
jgi:ankyrin repeat protein